MKIVHVMAIVALCSGAFPASPLLARRSGGEASLAVVGVTAAGFVFGALIERIHAMGNALDIHNHESWLKKSIADLTTLEQNPRDANAREKCFKDLQKYKHLWGNKCYTVNDDFIQDLKKMHQTRQSTLDSFKEKAAQRGLFAMMVLGTVGATTGGVGALCVVFGSK